MIDHTETVEIQIPFFDVDSMQMAWHGHYAKYFELARCRLLEALGHDYDAMRASGFIWPVVDLHVRYMRPLRFNQTVVVAATLKQWDQRLRIAYRVRDAASGVSLARGSTDQAPVDVVTGELYAGIPDAAAAAQARWAASVRESSS